MANQVCSLVLTVGLVVALAGNAGSLPPGDAAQPWPQPQVTLLDLHGVNPADYPTQPMAAGALPGVITQDGPAGSAGGPQQIAIPSVLTPTQSAEATEGKTGTGFFIGDNGILLTAAHVASGCSRMQIISNFVPRSWVSPIATDQDHDIALLKAEGVRPPAVVHLAARPPAGGKLFIMGYPATAGLTVPAETWAVMENEKFPNPVEGLTNPRDLLWMSAPDVTHGYSGGPIFDPRSGAVVGLVKGEVDGGYLRLVPDMPTTGIAIGPGIASIAALLRREVPYVAVNLADSPSETGVEGLRRATVHVLCWH